jgi:7-carboxy-7-deazaguanine synthase
VSALTASDLAPRELAKSAPSLVVSEIFGPTFQGEGPSLGRRCSFLRLGGCNLHCSWCDTPYTWDWTGRNGKRYKPGEELRRMSATEVVARLDQTRTDMVVISGGEPLLQQKALLPVLEMASERGWWIEIETAGTVAPTAKTATHISRFNVSPKLANSGNELERRYIPVALDALQATGKAIWKFVAQTLTDLDEAGEWIERHKLEPVFVMPEGVTIDSLSRHSQVIAEGVIARGWNLTTRLQILLYGNRRGV